MADPLIIPPPVPKIFDYPGAVGISFLIVFTAALLFVSGKFDSTGGVLTISLLIVLAMVGAVVFSLFFTIPVDQSTAALIGGLTAAFGAVVTYWLGRKGGTG
jgi:apolipoprotein N-acyltransferase